jgi:hypothetical protein
MPPPAAANRMKLVLVLVLALLAIAGCQPGSGARPVPSVAQIGGDLKCASGDVSLGDGQAGWGFCRPTSWRYIEKAQSSQSPDPVKLDITFDVTDVACTVAAAGSGGATPPSTCSSYLFAFMIISTYERGGSTNLADWVQANLHPPLAMTSISWGNADEAGRLSDSRLIALTPHHVVILDIRSGQGQLDLGAQMSARLSTWNFTY